MAVSVGAAILTGISESIVVDAVIMIVAATYNYQEAQQQASDQRAAMAAQQAALAARGVLLNVSGNVEPIPVVYGKRRMGGIRSLCEVGGASDEYLYLVITLGDGEISSVSDIQFNDVSITDERFADVLDYEIFLGEIGQEASPLLLAGMPDKWTVDHVGNEIAYLAFRLKYNRSAYAYGLPIVTSVPDGRLPYDPRTGLEVYSNNPALLVREYLTNTRYGFGIPAEKIDDASFAAGADYCDELVDIPDGQQARYTLNGLVDVSKTRNENLRSLLSSCRGSVDFSSGKYRLVLERQAASTFDFTEDNIVGAWEIRPPGRREKFNRVTSSFINPDKNWQPDYAIQQSIAYRLLDGGRVSEGKIDLPYTTNYYTAAQIGQQELKQSRFGLIVRFTAFQEAIRCSVGDVVTITHSTPGWVQKLFRVREMNPLDTDEVEVICREYSDSVFVLDQIARFAPAALANLPDPSTIGIPGNLTVVESLYRTSGSVGVRSRATVSWVGPADPYVFAYEVEYRKDDGVWVELFNVRGTTIDIDDLPTGMYEWRVKTINELGVASDYSAIVKQPLYGLVAAPADVVGFSIVAISGQGRASWNLHPDLDVRLGGRILFRWAPALMNSVWENAVPIGEANGDAMIVMLPLLAGTYLARAEDSSGNLSVNAVSFVASEALATGWTTVATSTQHPAFSGAKTNVAAVDGAIKLAASLAWDDIPGLFDSWGGTVDDISGTQSSGIYEFDAPLNFGTLAVRKLTANIVAGSYETADFFDTRSGLCDSWDWFDGAQVSDCEAALYVAVSDDGAIYGPWTPFMSGEFRCMSAKFRLGMASGNLTHNISVSQLAVTARIAA